MAEIDAERISFPAPEVVLRTGFSTFEEPYVKLAIQDDITDGNGGLSALLVDIVPYTKATMLAGGHPEAAAEQEAMNRYFYKLYELGYDQFEAQLYWEAYQDLVFTIQNPYAVQETNPYLTNPAQERQAANPDVGWGPRDMSRTPGSVD